MRLSRPNEPDIRDSLPDRDLLSQLVAGDPAALRFLRKRHETAIYAQVYAVVNDVVDTEHVVSETFLELSRESTAADEDESVHARLRRIARSRAQELRRSRGERRVRTGTA